jgi:hypothetical protein
VQEELEQSSAVFSGKVIGVVNKNKFNIMQSSADPIGIVFEVKEVWKGINQTQVIVNTARDSASCGYEFSSTEYLVYAHESNGELSVSLCSRTTQLSSAQGDIEKLGMGKKPTEEVSLDINDIENESKTSINIVLYSISLLLILILIYVYTNRRIKKRNMKG